MKKLVDYSLYLCTDRHLTLHTTFEECVELAIKGGVTVVQLREKNCSSREFFEIGLQIKNITERHKIPLIVNDRVDIAMAIDADGVHVGQSDLPCNVIRNIIGADKIIGVSASTVEEAVQAEREGADYLGVGAMFATNTKLDTRIVTVDTLKNIRQAVKIPIVAIGGINLETIPQIKPTGVNGVAVVSAIVSDKNPDIAARNLLNLWKA